MEDTEKQMTMIPQQNNSSPIYSPAEILFTREEQDNTPVINDSVNMCYNDRLQQCYGDDADTVSTLEDIQTVNNVLDSNAKEDIQYTNSLTVMDLAERGMSASDIVRWYQDVNQTVYPYGAGLYNQLKKANMLGQMESNSVIRSEYMTPGSEEAGLYDAMQNIPVNLAALNDMEIKAAQRFNEQGIAKRIGKGLSALIPFDPERVAFFNYSNIIRDHLGEYKEVKELSKLKDWNVNELFTAARGALHRAATGSVEKFKQILNDIDKDLLEQNITLGDRANFWQQINDTTYGLNRFSFTADLVGAGVVAKGAAVTAKVAKAAGATTKQALKQAGVQAIQETVPGTSVFNGIHNMNIWGWDLITGQGAKVKKAAKEIGNELAKASVIDPATYSEVLKSNAENFLRNSVAAAFSPEGIKTTVKADTTEADLLLKASLGIEDIEDMNRVIEMANYTDQTSIKRLSESLKEDAARDFQYTLNQLTVTPANKTQSVNMISTDDGFLLKTKIGIGPDGEQPFTSLEQAKRYANKFKAPDGDFNGFATVTEADVMVDADGAYVVLTRKFKDGDRTVALGDLVSAKLKESELANNPDKKFASKPLSQYLGGNITSDFVTGLLNNAKQADEGYLLRMYQPEFKAIRDAKKFGPVLDALMQSTRQRGAYFTTKTLRDAGVPDKAIEAYRALKRLDDTQYLTTAKAVNQGQLEGGIKNIYYKGERLTIGKRVNKPTDRKTIYVLDGVADNGDDLPRAILNDKVPLDQLTEDKYMFVNMTEVLDGMEDPVVAIPVEYAKLTDPDIMNTVFSYKPGRMLFSPDSGFIKQARTGKIIGSDGKEKTIVNGISTIFSHPDRHATQRIVDTLEQYRQLAIKVSRNEMTMDQAQAAVKNIDGYELVGSFEEFYPLTQKTGNTRALINLNPDAKLMYARDGDELLFDGLPIKDFNYKGASATQYTNSIKVMNKKKRGDSKILNPFNFGEAPRLNYQEEMSLAVGKILRYSTIDDYTKLYAQDFNAAFYNYLDHDSTPLSNMLRFDYTNRTSSVPEDVAKRMQNAKLNYMRMMGTPTEFDLELERITSSIADKLVPDLKNASESRLNWYRSLAKGNPVRAAKAMTFHWFLGLWNPRQMWKQALDSYNAWLISPVSGSWAVKHTFPIITYLNTGDEKVLAKFAKDLGAESNEVLEVAKIARQLDVYSQASHAGAFEKTASDIAKRGKLNMLNPEFFYLTGEYANRIMTAVTAAHEAYAKGVRASTMTAADRVNLIKRQQTLFMDMGRAGTSELQRGFSSFLTQFRGYQFRYIESMIGSQLTAAEKARLLLGQALFGGTKGFLGREVGATIYNATKSDDSPNHPIADLAYHGLLDWAALQADLGISFNDMVDVGLMQIADMALSGDLWSMPASVAVAQKMGANIKAFYNASKNYYSTPMKEREFTQFASVVAEELKQNKSLPSGMDKGLTAYLMLKSGCERLTNGAVSKEGVTAFESAMVALGFKTINSDIALLAKNKMDKYKADEKEVRRDAEKMFNNVINAATPREKEVRLAMFNNYLKLLAEEDESLARSIQKDLFSSKNIERAKRDYNVNLLELIAKKEYGNAVEELRGALKDYNERANEIQ